MAQFIPKRDETPEADKHQKWLEEKVKAQDKINAELNSKLDKLLRANATSGKQVAVINARVSDMNTGNGLPPGGDPQQILAKKTTNDYDAGWFEETVGGMRQEYYDVVAGGDGVSLLNAWQGKLYDFSITSPSDGSPFSVALPNMFNFDYDLAMPFYYLSIQVYDHSVELTMGGSVPVYMDHQGTYLLGTVDDGDGHWVVTLPAGYVGQWLVVGTIQIPDTAIAFAFPLNDGYHADSFGSPLVANATTPTVAATAAAGTGAAVTVTGTSTAGVVQLVTGTSPTTTGWGELLTFTSGWASGDVPVLALHPANQNAAGLTHYATRAGTEAEAHFDLTGIVASTTYLFHYSLLPFAA